MPRCPWATSEPALTYHDEEWGVPLHDDRQLFEFLILEGAQAGLSWVTILKKRENYRKAFDGFHAEKVARYGAREVKRLLNDPGIVRNRLKIAATIQNARSLLALQETTSFDDYLWQFVGGTPKRNRWRQVTQVPAHTAKSDAMSRDVSRSTASSFRPLRLLRMDSSRLNSANAARPSTISQTLAHPTESETGTR